ncbi:cysteine desulfurase family protein [Bacillus massilinigeriensis]|uniref:cysteine desulfurase family protein n=1 Tax=Bacillus massilionigeriensis TaxID=1805475 RepID=UPI00096B1E4B|nr:cysteine desulfurase family protein [Bacillus massilionigeriensis]
MIYFDNSATTKPYKEVLDSFVKVSTDYFANPSSLHRMGGQAEKLMFQAREQIAKLLNVKSNEIILTSGGTESNNLAIKGTALMHQGRGRHIITTSVEHPSVSESMEQLKQLGFRVTYIPVDEYGRLNVHSIEQAISNDTILVSVIHVNNEVGTIQPIEEIGRVLKKYPKVLFHVDHVQGIAKVPLDLHQSNIDLCSISGHKFHGLKGTGILYIREGVRISPLLSGGKQEKNIRSGTENVAGIVAMAKALRLVNEKRKTGLANLNEIKHYLYNELDSWDGVMIHTPKENSAPHIINFSIHGFKAEVFVHALEEKGVFVSTTSACSSKRKSTSSTLLSMGVSEEIANSAIRVSLSYDNTMEEAHLAVQAFKEVISNLRKVMN